MSNSGRMWSILKWLVNAVTCGLCEWRRFPSMRAETHCEQSKVLHSNPVHDLFPSLFHRLTPCIFRCELKPCVPLWLSREWHEAEWCDGKSMKISLSTAAAKERFKEHCAACKSTVLLSGQGVFQMSLSHAQTLRKQCTWSPPLLTVAETHCRSWSAESNKNSGACVCLRAAKRYAV